LRLAAEMTKKITLIGQGQKFEIWSEEIWNSKVSNWRAEETDESEQSVLSDLII